MPVQHIIVEAAIITAGVLIMAAAWIFARWEEQDDYRRHQRLVHRNLQRQSGGRHVTDWSSDASL